MNDKQKNPNTIAEFAKQLLLLSVLQLFSGHFCLNRSAFLQAR